MLEPLISKQALTSIRVDEELWKKAKIYAIEHNETLSGLVERLLKEEIEGKKRGGDKK